MSDTIVGACHCGAVTATIPAEAFGIVACHCGDCQKLHGNFFALLTADRDSIVWSGEEHVRWYDSSAKARRSFCGQCGSRLAKDPKGSPKLMLSVGLFDKLLPRRVLKNVFADAKPAWYELPAEHP